MPYKYSESSLPSSFQSEQLKLFSWLPEQPWRAAVFLQHGFRSHAHFNFLRNDNPSKRGIYGDGSNPNDTSLIRELNTRQLAVFAHDHVGHGRSTGVRAYFPSFKTLVDDAITHIRQVDAEHELTKREIPIFLLGHSMGGTISILVAREAPTLVKGIALSSAATEPPANMFGLMGKINRALSGITSWLFPYLEVMKLPKSPDAELQAIFQADELNCNDQGIRARVGREFLNAYEDISKNAQTFDSPFLSVHGENDTLVNPLAAKRFYDAAVSEDKTLQTGTGRWHNIFTENGKEEMWFLFADWISERCK
ncbi:Serine aminopeptidase S33 [Gracilaria domingensis]|nr:Serine aminopeptidase S33 [Gracilaria domingensis]